MPVQASPPETSENLAPAKVPRWILFADEIPRGNTGKPKRSDLANRYRDLARTNGDRPSGQRSAIDCRLIEIWKRVLGVAGMLAAVVFMLETGARGAFIAILLLAAVGLALSKHRLRLILIGAPFAALILFIAPAGVFHRLTLFDASGADAAGALDQDALGSQAQRLSLLQQSVKTALSHPLLGVGPGQFAVDASAELAREGKAAPWLGTHNSYTEVASECGIPAFLVYTTVIFLVLRSNFILYRRSTDRDTSALAFCLFAAAFAYAICTFFFHIAYSSYLPAIAGMSIALRLASRVPAHRRAPAA